MYQYAYIRFRIKIGQICIQKIQVKQQFTNQLNFSPEELQSKNQEIGLKSQALTYRLDKIIRSVQTFNSFLIQFKKDKLLQVKSSDFDKYQMQQQIEKLQSENQQLQEKNLELEHENSEKQKEIESYQEILEKDTVQIQKYQKYLNQILEKSLQLPVETQSLSKDTLMQTSQPIVTQIITKIDSAKQFIQQLRSQIDQQQIQMKQMVTAFEPQQKDFQKFLNDTTQVLEQIKQLQRESKNNQYIVQAKQTEILSIRDIPQFVQETNEIYQKLQPVFELLNNQNPDYQFSFDLKIDTIQIIDDIPARLQLFIKKINYFHSMIGGIKILNQQIQSTHKTTQPVIDIKQMKYKQLKIQDNIYPKFQVNMKSMKFNSSTDLSRK